VNAPEGEIADGVETVRFGDPREFLEYLRPWQSWWDIQPSELPAWVFRGQEDEQWDLVPTGIRLNGGRARLKALEDRLRPAVDELSKRLPFLQEASALKRKWYLQLLLWTHADAFAVREFARRAGELGMPILSLPSECVNHQLGQLYDLPEWSAPAFDPASLALARHHGIPTRLLDFTRSAMVAAFFAGENSEHASLRPKGLAVWAIRREVLNIRRVYVLAAPRHKWSFLHAQDALFLYDPLCAQEFRARGTWPSLREAVISSNLPDSCSKPYIRKVVLTGSESGHLLDLLRREHVDRAHLMPTLDNVVQAMNASWPLIPASEFRLLS
jgi:hypothetical protein